MSGLKKWFFIVRPFTLPASLSPVLVGLVAASSAVHIDILIAAVTIFSAISLQILSNLINDYCDFKKGEDSSLRLGPERAISRGIITEKQLLTAICIVAGLACISGLYLVYIGSWPIAVIGASALFFAWLYSATNYSLSHLGIADFFAISFYGFIASLGTSFLQCGQWQIISFWFGLASGLIAEAILTTNNIRDIAQDKTAGKNTIIVRLGTSFGKALYILCVFVAPVILFWVKGSLSASILCCICAIMLCIGFLKAKGRAYNKILMMTGFYNLAYAIMVLIF